MPRNPFEGRKLRSRRAGMASLFTDLELCSASSGLRNPPVHDRKEVIETPACGLLARLGSIEVELSLSVDELIAQSSCEGCDTT